MRVRLIVFCASLLIVSQSAGAQRPDSSAICYKFDRPYFNWVSKVDRSRGVDSVLRDSSNVLQLIFLRGDIPRRSMRPVGYSVDASATQFEQRRDSLSWWHAYDKNGKGVFSLFVAWLSNGPGPIFNLDIVGETLHGVVRYGEKATTFVLETMDKTTGATTLAYKVDCPGVK